MANIPFTSRAQTIFLRAFHISPTGPAPDQWPSPAILRRWLRKPGFRRALDSVQAALRLQSDFQLTTAATRATAQLASLPLESPGNLTPPESAQSKACPERSERIEKQQSKIPLESILRLAHVRRRFTAVEARHDTTQALTAELEQAQSELAGLRTQLAEAKEKLKFTVRLDPYMFQRKESPEAAPDGAI
jgi:hypothetical protein